MDDIIRLSKDSLEGLNNQLYIEHGPQCLVGSMCSNTFSLFHSVHHSGSVCTLSK